MNSITRISQRVLLASNKYQACNYSKIREELLPKNMLDGYDNMAKQATNGKPYDKNPYKMVLEKDKVYLWCLCGHSKTQPLCDGTHNKPGFKKFIKEKPVKVKVEETKEYWLCNCKATKHRPFCDGTHRSEEIQSKFQT
uniref:CDGSH iron-sulfur domain-containing protein 3, mitochondrial n=2 Tax=Cacopsylla melanoneura TaxID=428564 RepID=A0A8D9F3F7_9HEMI